MALGRRWRRRGDGVRMRRRRRSLSGVCALLLMRVSTRYCTVMLRVRIEKGSFHATGRFQGFD